MKSDTAMTTDLLFVYGTLRPGGHNYPVLEPLGELVGPATVRGTLFDLGPFPGVMNTDDDGAVFGDVFRVTTPGGFAKLDRFEDEGRLYERVATVARVGGKLAVVWMYRLLKLPKGSRVVAGGDYLAK